MLMAQSGIPSPPSSALEVPGVNAASTPDATPTEYIRISTTFYPGAVIGGSSQYVDVHPPPPDIILASAPGTDSAYFYVHTERLLQKSSNGFGYWLRAANTDYGSAMSPSDLRFGSQDPLMNDPSNFSEILASELPERFPISPPASDSMHRSLSVNSDNSGSPSPSSSQIQRGAQSSGSSQPHQLIITLPENAEVLNLLLHVIYDISPERYEPSLEALCRLPLTLLRYGCAVDDKAIGENSHVAKLLIRHSARAPIVALNVFSLAASYNLEYLAQQASKYAIGVPMTEITEQHCTTMGSSYLWRLMNLHGSRTASLKRILLVAPEGHPKNSPTLASCAGTEQRVLRAWAFATAYLAWESRPDLPSIVIAQALTPLLDHIHCPECRQNLQRRISDVLTGWTQVKDTI